MCLWSCERTKKARHTRKKELAKRVERDAKGKKKKWMEGKAGGC